MSEREKFEAWVRSKDSTAPLHRRDMKGSERIGQYCTHWIEDQWESWQASRRAAISEAGITAVIHSQYPVTTDFDRGYAKARADAAKAIRALLEGDTK